MKRVSLKKQIILLLFASGITFFLNGCQSVNEEETQIPWSRPANWEGGAPGVIGSPGRERY